jgi:hypothetical protein
MRRDAHDRPEPGVAFASEDNRVPGMVDRRLFQAVLSHAGAWLLHGRPAGARRVGLARPTTFRVWSPYLAPPALIAAACGVWAEGREHGVVAYGLLWIGAMVFGAAATIGTIIAAAIAHTLPPPRRPRCEGDTLPNGQPRPPRPPAADAPLFEYVTDEVWLCERPLRFEGIDMGTRMSVLRLDGGGLLIHSPVEIGPDLEAAVRALGEPCCIVAPNAIHHLYVAPWLSAFPDAVFVAAPGLLARRPDLAPALQWPPAPDQRPWSSDDIEAAVFEGHHLLREVALLHRRSHTLVLTDMILNLGHEDDELPSGQRRMLDLFMMSGRPTPPTDYKLGVDRDALGRSLEPMQSWHFERIVVAHGRLVEHDAREIFRDAFAFTI